MALSALIIILLAIGNFNAVFGVELFDPRVESCCNGKVRPKNHCGIGGCCGDRPFDVTAQVCCGGRLMPLSAGLRTACCGNITYAVGTQICCDGNSLVDVPEEMACRQASEIGCCNGKPFSKAQSLCCNGYVVPKPDDSAQAKCCGSAAYVPGDEECCAGTVYRSNELICCGGQVQTRPIIDAQCCGTQLYDFRSHACCNGNVQALSVRRNSNYSDGEMTCCGTELFRNSLSICCEGVIHPTTEYHEANVLGLGCCGNQTMDARNFLCCDGQQVVIRGPTSACCGKSSYDRKTQICCDGEVHNKPIENLGRFQGSILAIPQGSPVEGAVPSVYSQFRCCGKVLYNPEESVCCNKELVTKVGNKTSCCTPFSSPIVASAIGNIFVNYLQYQDSL